MSVIYRCFYLIFFLSLINISAIAQEIIKEEKVIQATDTLNNNHFSITLGYSYRTAPIYNQLTPQEKAHIKGLISGFNIDLNYSRYISSRFGPSVKYLYFTSESNTNNLHTTSSTTFIGGGVSSREMIGSKILLSADFYAGYTKYKYTDTVGNFSDELTGETIGLDYAIALNFFLTPQFSLQLQLSYLQASLHQMKDSAGTTYKSDEAEGLHRYDFNSGIKVNF